MATLEHEAALPRRSAPRKPLAPLATLVARRFQLSVRTPRELFVPLLTPILFALIHDADVSASSITARQPTLDDVYLQLTGGGLAEAA